MVSKIGRYTIERELGRGAMAQVYLAFDPIRNERVALKVLFPEFVQNRNVRRRFLREAAAIKRLDHNFIIPIYDFGESDNELYYTMAVLEGGTLADRIDQSKEVEIANETLIFYFERIAEAVDYIHRRGIVHRDIKPNNILFNRFGHPFLADFGVIQLNSSQTTNRAKMLIGTPAYMSPEQVMLTQVDHRSDLYALGIILFEMLTGQIPFDGGNSREIARMQVYAEVPQLHDFREVDKRWQKVIEKALAKDPEERYQSGAEMVTAVHQIVAGKRKNWLQTQFESVSQRMSSLSEKWVMAGAGREKFPFNWMTFLPIAAVLFLLGIAITYSIDLPPPPTSIATVPVFTPSDSVSSVDSSTATTATTTIPLVCRKDDEYNFKFGEPEHSPPLGSGFDDVDGDPAVRYQVINSGCPLITDSLELVSQNNTPLKAFHLEDVNGQEIVQLDTDSVGYLVLEFSPENARDIDDVWFLVVNDKGRVIELRFKSLIEIQVIDWMRLEQEVEQKVGQISATAVSTPASVQSTTNTPVQPTATPTLLPRPTQSSKPTVTTTPTATPNWHATLTHEAAVQKFEQEGTQKAIIATQTHQKWSDDATRTRQEEDAANNLTRTVQALKTTQTMIAQQTKDAQQATQIAINKTATVSARATEWAISQTRTREAQILSVTQTYETRPTSTRTPQPTNTPDFEVTATASTPVDTPPPTMRPTVVPPTNSPQMTPTVVPPMNTPQPTSTPVPLTNTPQPTPTPAPPTNTPQPTPTPPPPTDTPLPTEPPFIMPILKNPNRCVLGNNGFVQTPFQWTGRLNDGQSFAIRIAPNNQNPRNAGKFVKNSITTGNDGTNWSISRFDTGFTEPNKYYRWTVVVVEQGSILAIASQVGCFDNTGGSS